MIIKVQELNKYETFTEALEHILRDWEKTRYLAELERLNRANELYFKLVNEIVRHESDLKKE